MKPITYFLKTSICLLICIAILNLNACKPQNTRNHISSEINSSQQIPSQETAKEMSSETSTESFPEERQTFSIPETSIMEETSSIDSSNERISLIHPEGMTLGTRFSAPAGYTKIDATEGSLLFFMRNMELKPDGSPILLYDGTVETEDHDAAVFAMDVGTVNLQQCADSVIRIYAEYLWSRGAYDEIRFHLTNGFWMDYASWRSGKRLSVDGNNVQWVQTAAYDDSYETFRQYLTQLFVYAGTLSLDEHSQPISLEEVRPGDMLLKGGSPGHAILIVDMAINAEGKKCFLLAEGHLPAEDFHVIKNPNDSKNPWYYEEDMVFPFESPRFTFEEGSLQRYFQNFF